MSVCDTCRQPGHCCKIIFFYGAGLEDTDWIDDESVIEQLDFNVPNNPFVLVGKNHEGRNYWTCKNLCTITGKCKDYENRPQLCKDYEPKSCPLCIEYEETVSNPSETMIEEHA